MNKNITSAMAIGISAVEEAKKEAKETCPQCGSPTKDSISKEDGNIEVKNTSCTNKNLNDTGKPCPWYN